MTTKSDIAASAQDFSRAVALAVELQRERKRMSLDALAERTGIGLRTLKSYLRERERSIPLPALHKIATSLGTTPEVLVRDAQAELARGDGPQVPPPRPGQP